MASSRVLVILGDRQWTVRAVHLACTLARNLSVPVTLVKVVPVANAFGLGGAARHPGLDDPELAPLFDYKATAEDYGVPVELTYLHCASYAGGIASAAEQLEAAVVFAPSAPGRLALWRRLADWRLRRTVHVPLFTLQAGEPSIAVVLHAVQAEGAEGAAAGLPRPAQSQT